MKIKLCGLFREEDIRYANEVQPDYVGFVLAKSRRQISKETARRFRALLDPSIPAVGVFVDADSRDIIELLKEGTIDIAQLHGNETEDMVWTI